MTIVALYLSAVVAANLIVTALGPGASVVTAFALIGFNITARDRLRFGALERAPLNDWNAGTNKVPEFDRLTAPTEGADDE